jgi:2-hydroxychromene-2-carboxylate isomerase
VIGLDIDRFEADRRSDAVLARVRADFESGVRAGVVTTPTLFAGAEMYSGRLAASTLAGLTA